MKKYFIRKIEMVASNDYGKVLEIIANQRELVTCSDEQQRQCELFGFVHCPTFVMTYSKIRHQRLQDLMFNKEPMLIDVDDFRIVRKPLVKTNVTKVYYYSKKVLGLKKEIEEVKWPKRLGAKLIKNGKRD